MGLKQDLQAVRDTVGAVLHNTNTALAERGVPTVRTLAALPDAMEAVHEHGVSDGRQAAYDAFWDHVQQDGARANYTQGFAGQSWDDTTFKPKYDIICNYAERLFQQSKITDLKGILDSQGVSLDLTGAARNRSLTMLFDSSPVTHLPVIDTSTAPTQAISYLFYRARDLVSIEKWKISDTVEQTYNETTTFQECNSLERIVIEGTIWRSLSFQWCPLSRASIESVMAALSDTVTGQTVTFSKTAVNAAFTTDEWNTLVATKPNWKVEVM